MVRLFPPLAALTALWFVAIALWSFLAISAEAWYQPILDARPFGYDLESARLFLQGLSPLGKARYLGPMRVLDSVFPLLLAVTLATGAVRYGRGWLPWAVTICAAVGAAFDYVENAAIAGLLRLGSEGVDAAAVLTASALTVTKFVFYLAAFAGLGVAVMRRRA